MTIAVHDASILIDLITIDLIGQVFALGYRMVTTDFILEELVSAQRSVLLPFIADGRLTIDRGDAMVVAEIADLAGRYTPLSFADCSVLLCAQRYAAILLTGDKKLRTTAIASHLEVHGILWVLDKLVDGNIVTPQLAARRLEQLMDVNSRLPAEECRRRVHDWKQM